MKAQNILSVTPNPTIDKSSSIERVAPEIKLRCERSRYEPGGGGVNVARVLNRLDQPNGLLYPAGGPHGSFLQELLSKEGLTHEPVEIGGITRESFMVRETSSGQQYRFSHPGPELQTEEWSTYRERIETFLEEGTSYVVGSGSLPPGVPEDGYATIGEQVQEYGSRFVLDTAGQFLSEGIQGRPFLIKPNIRELGQLVDRELENEGEIVRVARSLVDEGPVDNVVVSIGAGGAYLMTAESEYRYRAPTVKIDSKVGAGDSMVAGIVYGLLETDTVRDAVRYGVAAGTAAVMTPGTELCHAEDVRDLYEKVRFHEITD